jgi:amidase
MEGLYISELSERMKTGDLSASLLVDYYLERIDAYDQSGPSLNSILTLNPNARDDAVALDQEMQDQGARGPLHGIPILLKDNIACQGPMATTAGSLALENAVAKKDAHIVDLLRSAGALILGKSNLSEWANFRSGYSSSGWSSLGGQTFNPYSLDRSPGGSSAGSAVAVAADFCAAAVGTETDGSIVSPASMNGIVGIKPTVGLVSQNGIIPISASQDTAGPMARNIADAAILLGAMIDDGEDYSQFLDPGGLDGARIGVPRAYAQVNDHVNDVFTEALKVMQDAGAEIVDPVDVPSARRIDHLERIVMRYEFKVGIAKYLADFVPDHEIKSLADIIRFNSENRARVMPYFGQDILLAAEASGDINDDVYLEALATCRRLTREQGIDQAMADHNLDALVAPTRGQAWLIDWATGDGRRRGSSTLAAVAGYPSISVPMGAVFGLPVGVSFIAGANAEPRLIQLASGYEHHSQARRAPTFREELFTRGKSRQATP